MYSNCSVIIEYAVMVCFDFYLFFWFGQLLGIFANIYTKTFGDPLPLCTLVEKMPTFKWTEAVFIDKGCLSPIVRTIIEKKIVFLLIFCSNV